MGNSTTIAQYYIAKTPEAEFGVETNSAEGLHGMLCVIAAQSDEVTRDLVDTVAADDSLSIQDRVNIGFLIGGLSTLAASRDENTMLRAVDEILGGLDV